MRASSRARYSRALAYFFGTTLSARWRVTRTEMAVLRNRIAATCLHVLFENLSATIIVADALTESRFLPPPRRVAAPLLLRRTVKLRRSEQQPLGSLRHGDPNVVLIAYGYQALRKRRDAAFCVSPVQPIFACRWRNAVRLIVAFLEFAMYSPSPIQLAIEGFSPTRRGAKMA